jgi:signal transduction histidine kinase
MTSIRRQLLFWQIGALLATGLLASLITYSLAWDGFNRLRDYGLEQIAYSIVRHGVVSDDGEPELDPADRDQFVSQIWKADGSVAYTSIEGAGPPPQPPGLHTINWEGEEWHIYTLKDGGLTIQVGNPVTKRARIFANIIPLLMLPLSLLILLLGGFIWISVGKGLAPLERLRAELGRKDAGSLTPLDDSGLPSEVAPLIATLNELLQRLDAALTAQGRFVADAAHELRTPLTAVRLQAQLARQAADASARDASFIQLIAGVDRATHLVEQLLQMARLEPGAWVGRMEPVALHEIARQAVATLSTQAETKGIDLGLGSCAPAQVLGHAPGLRAMLDNLIDNALRYIPPGGQVDVELQTEAGQAILSVADNGPGITKADQTRVFDRFYRGAGVEQPGSGLGLAIVRQVVELHHGQVELVDTPGGGLTARVILPLLAPD